MNHQQILEALKENGVSFSSLANATNRTYQSLTAVSKRDSKSKKAADIIAAGVGKPVSEVFPDIPEYAEKKNDSDRLKRTKELLNEAGIEAA